MVPQLDGETQVLVGNLPADVAEKDLVYVFSKYGQVVRAEPHGNGS